MSDKPHCYGNATGARCSTTSNSGLTLISFFNGNLRSFRELTGECKDQVRCFNVKGVSALKTASKVLGIVAGCTTEGYKCIQ
jgi:hypothetical protein